MTAFIKNMHNTAFNQTVINAGCFHFGVIAPLVKAIVRATIITA